MKKILALTLAVMMMATIAFAVDVAPGTNLKFNMDFDGTLTDSDTSRNVLITSTPLSSNWTKERIPANYAISTVKWTTGSALVASISINDDGQVSLKLKQDYALELGKNKFVEGTFKITEKGTGKSAAYEIKNPTGGYELKVGYVLDITTIALHNGVSLATPDDDTIYKAVKSPESYDTVSFNDALGNEISVRMYDGEKYFLATNNDPDLDIVKKYDGTDADLRFVGFDAKPTFSSNASYYFYTADEDEFIYTINNGALTLSAAKWSKDDGCWVLKTRTLGNYVISDKKLTTTTAANTTDVPNPGTGANDVVGIAAALAAVALMSAAAVSLKK